MIHRIPAGTNPFVVIAVFSLVLFNLISCSPMTEVKKDISTPSAVTEITNSCVMTTLTDMGLSSCRASGPSPHKTVITASEPEAVFATSPVIVIDVLTDSGLNNIQVTAKGIGGLFPVSAKELTERTEEFQVKLMACLKECGG